MILNQSNSLEPKEPNAQEPQKSKESMDSKITVNVYIDVITYLVWQSVISYGQKIHLSIALNNTYVTKCCKYQFILEPIDGSPILLLHATQTKQDLVC